MWTLLAGGLAFITPAHAERPARPDLELRLPAHEIEVLHLPLPGGPEVAVVADTTAPVVAVATLVGGGLASEPLDGAGMAAATAERWLATIAAEDLALGARTRAEILPDGTLYVTDAPAEALTALLEREVRRRREPVPDRAPRTRSRLRTGGVVADPQFGPLFVALWGDHPYARLGRAPGADFAAEDLRAWAATTPRTTVAILGGVDLDAVGHGVLAAFAPHMMGDRSRPGQRHASRLAGLQPDRGFRIPRVRGQSLEGVALPAPAAASELSSPHVGGPTALIGWTLPANGAWVGPLTEQAADLVITALRDRFEADPRVEGISCDRVAGELGTSLVCAVQCRDAEAARSVAAAAPRTRFARGLRSDTRDWHQREGVAVVHELWSTYDVRARSLVLHLHGGGGPLHMADRLRGHDYDAIDVRRYLRDWVGAHRAARVVLLPGGSR